ncbi:MAG: hypothetical protein Q8L27_02685 [archaeon]|nr:hypothetical protein [archaeon]
MLFKKYMDIMAKPIQKRDNFSINGDYHKLRTSLAFKMIIVIKDRCSYF